MKRYAILAATLLLAACSGNKSNMNENIVEAAPAASVHEAGASGTLLTADSVDAVTSATNVANSPTFNGIMMVSPQQKATLSLTMGGKIHSLHVMPGQAVSRGETIATIDNPEYIELQQTYLDAAAQLEYLEKEFNRQSTLGDRDAASQKKVQQSKAEYLSMKARYEAAASRLQTLGIAPQQLATEGIAPYLTVKAPISGFVTNLTANMGTYLDAGDPICDLIDKSKLLLQLTVYEKDLGLIQKGGEVEFRVNGMGKQTFRATIVSIDQSVTSDDYSIKVYARIQSSCTDFRPGMYVRARVK